MRKQLTRTIDPVSGKIEYRIALYSAYLGNGDGVIIKQDVSRIAFITLPNGEIKEAQIPEYWTFFRYGLPVMCSYDTDDNIYVLERIAH